jgi:hypothetical protein
MPIRAETPLPKISMIDRFIHSLNTFSIVRRFTPGEYFHAGNWGQVIAHPYAIINAFLRALCAILPTTVRIIRVTAMITHQNTPFSCPAIEQQRRRRKKEI